MEIERFNACVNLDGNAWKSSEGTDVEVYVEGESLFLRVSFQPDGSLSVFRNYTGKWFSMAHCEDVTEPEVIEACQGIFTSEKYANFADQKEMTEDEKDYLVGELTEIFLYYFN